MKSYICIDNGIFSHDLKASTIRVLVCLLSNGRKRTDPVTGAHTVIVRKAAGDLMELCHCSRETFYAAIQELKELQLLQVEHTYRYSGTRKRLVWAKNSYAIDLTALKNGQSGYFRIPRAFLRSEITHNAFLVALYLYRLVGGKDRAYPSLRQLGKYLGMAHSSICDALRQLRKCLIFIRAHCRRWSWYGVRLSMGYCCNSYLPTYSAGIAGQNNTSTFFAGGGGTKIEQLPVNNKITGVLYSQEKNKVFSIYSTLYKNIDRIRQTVTGALGTLLALFRPRSKDTP